MLSPPGLPQPVLQRLDAGVVTSRCEEKVLKALDAGNSLLALSSPFQLVGSCLMLPLEAPQVCWGGTMEAAASPALHRLNPSTQ